MGKESDSWQQIVSSYQGAGEVKWEPVGGINPVDGPVALCVGGNNRLTGQLAPDFWGASCDADEEEVGGFLRKELVPTAILAKAHMPDLAKVVPAFNVESIEASELVKQKVSRLKVEFSPGFLEWTTTIDREVDFGINDRQLWFLWRLKERSSEELKLALVNAGQLFRRLHAEMEEEGIHTYPAGPWNAGLAPFPPD
jgi:hypothetical protein